MDFKYTNFDFKVKSSAIKILTPKSGNILFFIYVLLSTKKFIPLGHNRHYISIVQNLELKIPRINEQQKIAHFFSLLDKQIWLWERKLELTELFLKSYKEKLFNYKKGEREFDFLNIFKEYDVRNTKGLPQYTIGKLGLKKIELKNYNIKNHKIFFKHSLIVGLSYEESLVSLKTEGSCSPIYKTFLFNENFQKYDWFFYFFIKRILQNNRNKICKKSTRRLWELEYKLLNKMKINLPENPEFVDLLKKIEEKIRKISKKISLLKNIKQYYLNNIFI